MNPFIEGRNAGISMIPVKKGTKIPAIAWKEFQIEICSELQAVEWGSDGHDFGVGAVTGEVSGRLMALDFEAGFDQWGELAVRLKVAGIGAVFDAWLAGYRESTPSGGVHVLVRLEGEGRCPPNEKFAVDGGGKVLVETRGEGGYVLVAPTVGYLLGSGGLSSIAYCTWDEWCRVEAVLRTFDTQIAAPPARTVDTRSTVSLDPMLRLGDSWIDNLKASLPPIRQLLEQHGWIFPGSSDQFGEHCVRPGKNPREGHSANLSHDGYLYVHSSNANLPVGVGLDNVALLICWQTGQRTVPDVGERTVWFQAQRPTAAEQSGVGAAPREEVAPNISTDFWTARGYLTHIHQAALSLRLSPDAVWEGVKCFYAATIPWNHRLPGDGTVDYVSIVVGESGAGKSRAKHTAWRLLEKAYGLTDVAFPVPCGSGEGMTEFYLERDDKNRRYKRRGVGFYADEAKFLLDIGSRSGNTTMQAIKQMWSGELTGSVAATAERHRWLDPHAVRGTLLISATPDVAAAFMRQDLTDEGLPQRLSWAAATYPQPDTKPDWPGALDIPIWDNHHISDHLYEIELHPDLATMIDRRLLAAARGEASDQGLEGHATYATEKTAAIHAHLDGRLNINLEDWDLAAQDWEVTRKVRQHVTRSQLAGLNDRNIAVGQARADQKVAETDRLLEKAVQSLTRKLTNHKTALNKRQIKDHLRSFSRHHGIHYQEVIDLATSRGLITPADGGYLST